MALNDIGHPFQGVVWYWVEDTYGGGESSTTLPVSSYVQSVRIGTGEKGRDIRNIGSAVVAERIVQTNEPTLSIEYNPQIGDYLISDTVERSACCELQSLAFCVGANTCIGGDNDTYYTIVGAKPSTVKISAKKNDPYTVSIDFQAKSVTTVMTGSAPSELTGAIMQFHVGGEITKTSGWVVDTDHIGYIVDSIDISIDHQLTGYTDHDALDKSFLVEGAMDAKGTVNVSLDGAGGMHMAEVIAFTDFTITVNMGGTGAVKLTLPGCNWDSSTIEVGTSGEMMMENASFTATPSSCSGIVSVV